MLVVGRYGSGNVTGDHTFHLGKSRYTASVEQQSGSLVKAIDLIASPMGSQCIKIRDMTRTILAYVGHSRLLDERG